MVENSKNEQTNNRTINMFIREKREELNISQRDLARRLNISKSYINKIEAGISKKPSYIVLLDLCKELKLSLEEKLYLFKEFNYSSKELDKIGLIEICAFKGIKGTDKIEEYTTINNGEQYIDIIKILKGYRNRKLNEAEVIGLMSVAIGISNLNMYLLPEQRKEYGLEEMSEIWEIK